MPTGYTASIKEKGFTFKDYALLCARNFGALIHMRDEPFSNPIVKPELSTWYYDKLKEVQEEYNDFKESSIDQLKEKFKEEVNDKIKSYTKRCDEANALLKEYNKFLKEAYNYIPPNDNFYNYKKFMIEQLEMSIKGDCNIDYYLKEIKKLKEIDFEDWYEEKIKKYLWDIERYTKEQKNEEERNKKSSEWIDQLIDSLKGY